MEIEEHCYTEGRLRDAIVKAEQANKAKSDFLASMSHELRTPLNTILGFSEALSHEFCGTLNAKQHEYIGHVHASGAHLLRIINDLLDTSKIDAGRLTLVRQPLDITEIIAASVALLRPKAETHQVAVTVELAPDLPVMAADELRLRQILLNLLSNAVKFAPPGGRVGQCARVREGNQVEITISDTGVGMAPQDIPRALEMFAQVENTLTRKHSGTGIGLPLVKALVELHGGQLNIDSAPGHGTTVTVRLPMTCPVGAA